jgi:protein-S-isoprenylcysteine O-methyltransferase Ste14
VRPALSAPWVRNFPLPQAHLIGLGVGIAAGFLSSWTFAVPAWLRLVGGCLAVLGLVWAAWATWASADTHLADPDRVVRRGPYAVGRNPMYVGWTMTYLGIGLALASVWLLLLLPGVLLLTHLEVRREEKRLRDRFGAAYAAYLATTRRYL